MAATEMAQSKHALVGTWKLVSATDTSEKGGVRDSMGPNPIGFLTYAADGRVSVVMGDSRRKPFLKYPPPAEEVVDAFKTSSGDGAITIGDTGVSPPTGGRCLCAFHGLG
jgi:Lipocalin-like domain